MKRDLRPPPARSADGVSRDGGPSRHRAVYRRPGTLIRPGGAFLNGGHTEFGHHLPASRTVARTAKERRRGRGDHDVVSASTAPGRRAVVMDPGRVAEVVAAAPGHPVAPAVLAAIPRPPAASTRTHFPGTPVTAFWPGVIDSAGPPPRRQARRA